MALLAGSVLLVLIVELLNSGIEAAIDRVSYELHDLSKRAKDVGERRGNAVAGAVRRRLGRGAVAAVHGVSAMPFSLCVYCGSRHGVRPSYAAAARQRRPEPRRPAAGSWSTAAARSA